jgi:hypothetical protein
VTCGGGGGVAASERLDAKEARAAREETEKRSVAVSELAKKAVSDAVAAEQAAETLVRSGPARARPGYAGRQHTRASLEQMY